eukprot:21567-Heterococcus_DN1.PRE.5
MLLALHCEQLGQRQNCPNGGCTVSVITCTNKHLSRASSNYQLSLALRNACRKPSGYEAS